MGLQSLLFYCFVAWLPTILAVKGFDAEAAGYLFSIYQVLGIPASFITPLLAGRKNDQRWVVCLIAGAYVLGLLMITAFQVKAVIGIRWPSAASIPVSLLAHTSISLFLADNEHLPSAVCLLCGLHC